MTDERRYGDEEIRRILDRAVEADSSALPAGREETGLTLRELQEVAREAGIDPQRVAEAAAALQVQEAAPPARRSLGMPVSTGRVLSLPRTLTDTEWGTLVGDLRQTFQAKGHVEVHGGFREWRNGNLYVAVEPGESGGRLRMGTVNGGALRLNTMGMALGGMASLLTVVDLIKGGAALSEDLSAILILVVAAVAMVGRNLLMLPRWGDERQTQFGQIAGRVSALVAEPEAEDGT